MLKFIGTGSAFNVKRGNNSAYFKSEDGSTLYLIDCGSTTYSRLIDRKIMSGVLFVRVIITHTHPDHIGSLGDLIFHLSYNIGLYDCIRTTVYAPKEMNVVDILKHQGLVDDVHYIYKDIPEDGIWIDAEFNDACYVVPVKVNHVAELECRGYIITQGNKKIYYSGDANMIPEDILMILNQRGFTHFYQDVSGASKNPVHLTYTQLLEMVSPDALDRVTIMHLDDKMDYEEARILGIKIAGEIE